MWRRNSLLFSLLQSWVAALLLCSCAAVRDQRAEMDRVLVPLQQGDLSRAAVNAKATARDHDDDGDGIVTWLEAGAVLQAAGRFQESIEAFARADELINDIDSRPTVSARDGASELAALATNARMLPYRGTQSDRILLPTMQALNYLALGQTDGARVELIRAYGRQKDAVANFQKSIESAGGALQQKQIQPGQVDTGRVRRALHHNGPAPLAAYADFVNPLTVYLDALFFMGSAENSSDLERARKSFERMAGFSAEPDAFGPERRYLEERMKAGSQPEAKVVVLALTGLAPERQEWRIDLPIPINPVVHAGLALPQLGFQPDPAPPTVGPERMRLVADLNGVVAREFDETFDAVVFRAVAGAAARATGQYQLQRFLGNEAWIAGVIGSIVVTGADLRAWRTAPGHAQRAWLTRPADGKLRVRITPGAPEETVPLPEAPLVLVYIRRIPGAPALIVPIALSK